MPERPHEKGFSGEMRKKIKKIFIQNKYKNLNKYSKCKNVIKSKSEIKQVKSIL